MSFLDGNKLLGFEYPITETGNLPDTVPVFRNGIKLRDYQQLLLQALLEVEDKQYMIVQSNKFANVTASKVIVETSAVILSEKPGAGKTIIILALIMARPIPTAWPTNINIFKNNWDINTPNTDGLFKLEVLCKYNSAVIRPNLVIVGSNVLIQWENTIKKYTLLSCFTIVNYYSLQIFEQLYKQGKIDNYDIVLLKNWIVTNTNGTCTNSIVKLQNITLDRCWSRVIYDDFDTLKIPASVHIVNSLFSIYVSTTKYEQYSANYKYNNNTTCTSCINEARPYFKAILRDKILNTNFKLLCAPGLVDNSLCIPIIEYYFYTYKNPNDTFLNIMGQMGNNEVTQILEMINGDAMDTAANMLGITSRNVADIFKKVLDVNYNKYNKYIKHAQYTQDIIDIVSKLPMGRCNVNMTLLHNAIESKTMPRFEYQSPALIKTLQDIQEKLKVDAAKYGKALNRVIENLREDMCQICNGDLVDTSILIMRCCGLILCCECGVKGNKFNISANGKATTIKGKCANCMSNIFIDKDLIFLDRGFDLESILDISYSNITSVDTCQSVLPQVSGKMDALINIIRGVRIESAVRKNIFIKNLISGTVDIPYSGLCKVVVFANYNETISKIQDTLQNANIQYVRLMGAATTKANIIYTFETTNCVLLINASQDCAGINIPFCTDIIFFHKIYDKHIETQVIGRGQRIGRKGNLRVHYLTYTFEDVKT
jgi:SNF2 family DNA or RNA helicase